MDFYILFFHGKCDTRSRAFNAVSHVGKGMAEGFMGRGKTELSNLNVIKGVQCTSTLIRFLFFSKDGLIKGK
jgi:hypothetical protein